MSYIDKQIQETGGVNNARRAAGIMKEVEAKKAENAPIEIMPMTMDIEMAPHQEALYHTGASKVLNTTHNGVSRDFLTHNEYMQSYEDSQKTKFLNREPDAIHGDTIQYTDDPIVLGSYGLGSGSIQTNYVDMSERVQDSLATADPQRLKFINEINTANSPSSQSTMIHEEAHAKNDGRPLDGQEFDLDVGNKGVYAPGCNPKENALINVHDEIVARLETNIAFVEGYNLSENKQYYLDNLPNGFEYLKPGLESGLDLNIKEHQEYMVKLAEYDYDRSSEVYAAQAESVAEWSMSKNNNLTIASDNTQEFNSRLSSMYSNVGGKDFSDMVPNRELSQESINNIDNMIEQTTGMSPQDCQKINEQYQGLSADERDSAFLNDVQEKGGIKKDLSQENSNASDNKFSMTPAQMQAMMQGRGGR